MLLAGLDVAEVHTTLTLTVVSAIVTIAETPRERRQVAEAFTRQVREYIARDDIVEWIQGSIVGPFQGGTQ